MTFAWSWDVQRGVVKSYSLGYSNASDGDVEAEVLVTRGVFGNGPAK